MKNELIRIQEETINSSTIKELRGAVINQMLSPFDIPSTAESDYDAKSGVFELKFNYGGFKEATRKEHFESTDVKFKVGKDSERIYSIIVNAQNMKALDEKELSVNISKMLNTVLSRYPSKHPSAKSRSFEAINRIIKSYSSNLFSSEKHIKTA